MFFVRFIVIVLSAVRIFLYRRLFHICVGKCRISGKIAVTAFLLLWIFESFLFGSAYIGPGITMLELFLFIVEILFLFFLSFCYRGSMAARILVAVFQPVIYWGGKWSIGRLLFGWIKGSREYLAVTAAAFLLFCLWSGILWKAGKSRQERERELLEEEIRLYEKQFNVIRQSQDHIRSLKHDMKHHIKMLADMVAEDKKEEALKYLQAMGVFMENSEEYAASGNEKIDSILNDMISRAKNKGVDVRWKIQIPEGLKIETFDINVILSNLFENAMHALEDIAEPSLYIAMRYDRNVLCINVKNNCPEVEPFPPTAQGHGFGLKNIRRIAEKYHGSLEVAEKDGIFTANVLLLL